MDTSGRSSDFSMVVCRKGAQSYIRPVGASDKPAGPDGIRCRDPHLNIALGNSHSLLGRSRPGPRKAKKPIRADWRKKQQRHYCCDRSVNLHLRIADDARPFGDFRFHESSQFLGRAVDRLDCGAQERKTVFTGETGKKIPTDTGWDFE